MALSTDRMTLMQMAMQVAPDGSERAIVEILNKSNPIIQDAVWDEANETDGHRYNHRVTLPTGAFRVHNQGVAVEKSDIIAKVAKVAMLESFAEFDKSLLKKASNPEAIRMRQGKAHIEGMGQTLVSTVLYGNNATEPEKFTGLANYMPSLADNVISAGGSGSDLTSVYVVKWELGKVWMAYPRSHPSVGVEYQDLEEVTLTDSAGKLYQGYRDHYSIHCGLVVEDPRYIGRLCNIETSGATGLFNEDLLIKLMNEFPDDGAETTIYVSKGVKTKMEILLKDKRNINYTTAEGLGGVPILHFRGSPVHKLDGLVETEAAVS
jgi:hypothetical protein